MMRLQHNTYWVDSNCIWPKFCDLKSNEKKVEVTLLTHYVLTIEKHLIYGILTKEYFQVEVAIIIFYERWICCSELQYL